MNPGKVLLTKEHYLEEGWRILQEELGWDAANPHDEDPTIYSSGKKDKGPRLLAAVNAGDIVDRVKRTTGGSYKTTGGFYHRWDTRKKFVDDLAAYLLNKERQQSYLLAAQATFEAGLIAGQGIVDLIKSVCSTDLTGAAKSAGLAAQMNLWSVSRRYPTIRDLLRSLYSDIDAEWAERYSQVMTLNGWKFRPGVTANSLAIVLGSIAEGMAVRHAVDPQAATPELFGRAIAAIVLSSIDWEGSAATVETALEAAAKAHTARSDRT